MVPVAARVALWGGAVASAALTAYVGWHGARVLIAPFLVWVLSPFAVLWWLLARPQPDRVRSLLTWATLLVAAGSVAAYAVRLAAPPRAQGAFVFVIVPPIAWIGIAVVMLLARATSVRPPS